MAEVTLDLEDADGGLPDICMCCGDEATVTKTKNMSWCPPWVGVLIVAGALPWLIVAMIMTKRARVQAPLCDQHQGHWFNRHLIVWGLFVLSGVLIVMSLVGVSLLPRQHQDNLFPFACIGSLVIGVGWLIVLIVAQSTAIRPKEITEHEITLQGVAEEFVDAVTAAERERRSRKKRRRDEDDDYDDPPPVKKKSSASGIVDKKRRRDDEEEDEDDRPRKKKRPRHDDDD